jgi:hypothetical protein
MSIGLFFGVLVTVVGPTTQLTKIEKVLRGYAKENRHGSPKALVVHPIDPPKKGVAGRAVIGVRLGSVPEVFGAPRLVHGLLAKEFPFAEIGLDVSGDWGDEQGETSIRALVEEPVRMLFEREPALAATIGSASVARAAPRGEADPTFEDWPLPNETVAFHLVGQEGSAGRVIFGELFPTAGDRYQDDEIVTAEGEVEGAPFRIVGTELASVAGSRVVSFSAPRTKEGHDGDHYASAIRARIDALLGRDPNYGKRAGAWLLQGARGETEASPIESVDAGKDDDDLEGILPPFGFDRKIYAVVVVGCVIPAVAFSTPADVDAVRKIVARWARSTRTPLGFVPLGDASSDDREFEHARCDAVVGLVTAWVGGHDAGPPIEIGREDLDRAAASRVPSALWAEVAGALGGRWRGAEDLGVHLAPSGSSVAAIYSAEATFDDRGFMQGRALLSNAAEDTEVGLRLDRDRAAGILGSAPGDLRLHARPC